MKLTLAALIALQAWLCVLWWPQAIDGDGIRYGWTSYRIRGMDSPETRRGQTCEARLGLGSAERELALGEAAKRALEALMASGDVWLSDVDYRSDRWGRPIADAWVGDVLVSEAMIAEGHAVTYSGGRRDHWCG
jgi:micrococcal nuclease